MADAYRLNDSRLLVRNTVERDDGLITPCVREPDGFRFASQFKYGLITPCIKEPDSFRFTSEFKFGFLTPCVVDPPIDLARIEKSAADDGLITPCVVDPPINRVSIVKTARAVDEGRITPCVTPNDEVKIDRGAIVSIDTWIKTADSIRVDRVADSVVAPRVKAADIRIERESADRISPWIEVTDPDKVYQEPVRSEVDTGPDASAVRLAKIYLSVADF